MTKKNLDSLRTYAGPNQSARNLVEVAGIGFTYPAMSVQTHHLLLKNMREELQSIHGRSKLTDLLADSVALIDALQIKLRDMPIAECVDRLIDEAHEEQTRKEST